MIGFDWFSQPGVKNVLSMVYTIVDIIRIIVPILLIIMTTIDITKKIIDPSDKEGQKKIMYRAIAAVLVFFVPTLINIVFKIMDIDVKNLKQGGGTPIVVTTPTATPKPTVKPTIVPTPTSTPKPTPTPKPKLSSITLYCPGNGNYSKIGDVVEIKTDIPASFTGEIEWKEDTGSVKITPIDGNRSAKIEILDQPKLAAVWIVVVAGGSAKSCHIDISALDKLEITNCPDTTKIYHVGDSFVLESNLPSYYKSSYSWGGAVDPNIAKVTPMDNGRRAQIDIIGVPNDKYIHIAVAADSPVKSSVCRINIE